MFSKIAEEHIHISTKATKRTTPTPYIVSPQAYVKFPEPNVKIEKPQSYVTFSEPNIKIEKSQSYLKISEPNVRIEKPSQPLDPNLPFGEFDFKPIINPPPDFYKFKPVKSNPFSSNEDVLFTAPNSDANDVEFLDQDIDTISG